LSGATLATREFRPCLKALNLLRAFERSGVPFFEYFLWHQRKYWQELWSLVTFFGIKESNGRNSGLWLLSLASKKVTAGIVVFGYFLWHQRK
jgi:hypothetical protein